MPNLVPPLNHGLREGLENPSLMHNPPPPSPFMDNKPPKIPPSHRCGPKTPHTVTNPRNRGGFVPYQTSHAITPHHHITPHQITPHHTWQHNTTQHNTTEHNTTQRNHTTAQFCFCHEGPIKQSMIIARLQHHGWPWGRGIPMNKPPLPSHSPSPNGSMGALSGCSVRTPGKPGDRFWGGPSRTTTHAPLLWVAFHTWHSDREGVREG